MCMFIQSLRARPEESLDLADLDGVQEGCWSMSVSSDSSPALLGGVSTPFFLSTTCPLATSLLYVALFSLMVLPVISFSM